MIDADGGKDESVRVLVAALLMVTVAACQQPVELDSATQCDFLNRIETRGPVQGPVLVPLVPGSMEVMPLNAVNITDVAIANKIVVQSTNARRGANRSTTVFARLVNCTDYPLQVEARTYFFDGNQQDAEPVTAWQRLHAPARTVFSYTTRSTARAVVKSYLIEVREGR